MIITADPIIVGTAEGAYVQNMEAEGATSRFPMEMFISRPTPNGKASMDFGWWGARSLPEQIPENGPIPIKDIREWTYSIAANSYGAAEEWQAATLRHDQTGQASLNVGAVLAKLTMMFQDKLATDRLMQGIGATFNLAYDGQNFIDTDHADAPSGFQSNDLTSTAVDGTAPTDTEFQNGVKLLRNTIANYKDDALTAKPLNLTLTDYIIMVPQNMEDVAWRHFGTGATLGGGQQQVIDASGHEGRDRGQRWGINQWWTDTDAIMALRPADGNTVGPLVQNMDVPWHMSMWAPEDERELFHVQKFHTAYRSEQEIHYGWWRNAVYLSFE